MANISEPKKGGGRSTNAPTNEMGSSRKSGSLQSESARTGKPSISATKQVGGGGRIAKPPVGGVRRDSKAEQ